MPHNRQELIEAIRRGGLEHLLPSLSQVMGPALQLVPIDGDADALGTTRMGGLPDLAPTTPWPHVDGIPLMFVGQVRLDDLTVIEHGEPLPPSGLISFFFDGMLTGYDEGKAADRSYVLHTTAHPSMLVRREPPPVANPVFQVFEPTLHRTREVWTLPAFEEIDGDEYPTIPPGFPIIQAHKDRTAYQALRRAMSSFTTRLLGHPTEVQGGEVRFNQVLSRDVHERYRYENYEYTHKEELAAEIRELVLLLQAPCEPTTHIDIAGGSVTFWIRRSDLAEGRFDRAWADLACS